MTRNPQERLKTLKNARTHWPHIKMEQSGYALPFNKTQLVQYYKIHTDLKHTMQTSIYSKCL